MGAFEDGCLDCVLGREKPQRHSSAASGDHRCQDPAGSEGAQRHGGIGKGNSRISPVHFAFLSLKTWVIITVERCWVLFLSQVSVCWVWKG